MKSMLMHGSGIYKYILFKIKMLIWIYSVLNSFTIIWQCFFYVGISGQGLFVNGSGKDILLIGVTAY